MTAKKAKVSASDRDILRSRASTSTSTASAVDDRPPARFPPLGDTAEEILKFLNAISIAVIDGDIDEKRGDTLTAMARTALNTVKHRDTKAEDAELDEMLRRAEAVDAAGQRREADDRRHVVRGADKPPDGGVGDG